VLVDDPGEVKNQITNVVFQIQRFDFDCNLEVTLKSIIPIAPGLDSNSLPVYTKLNNLVHVPYLQLYLYKGSVLRH
jgi:hypothetical protein